MTNGLSSIGLTWGNPDKNLVGRFEIRAEYDLIEAKTHGEFFREIEKKAADEGIPLSLLTDWFYVARGCADHPVYRIYYRRDLALSPLMRLTGMLTMMLKADMESSIVGGGLNYNTDLRHSERSAALKSTAIFGAEAITNELLTLLDCNGASLNDSKY